MFRGLFEIVQAYRRSREPLEANRPGQGQDRRMFYRVSVEAACRMSNPTFGLEGAGTTVDMSLDGLGVRMPVNWSHGSRVRLQVESASFEADAVIVFRKEEAPHFRYGLRFHRTHFFQILRLRRFLQKYHSGKLSL